MKILIDPGHGGQDPGAVAGDVREADINLAIAGYLMCGLVAVGYQASMTRHADTTVSLSQRVAAERKGKWDLFVSIHANAATHPHARGMEVWTSPGRTRSDCAATEIFDALADRFSGTVPMRRDDTDGDPDREARYYVLTRTRCPAVLVEVGFVTNDQDRAIITDREKQQEIAHAIAKGVIRWAGKAA